MSSGFRDMPSLLLRQASAHAFWQTEGPYRLAAAAMFQTGAAAGGLCHAGVAAAVVSSNPVIAGQCHA